ncbi:MAG: hypothetical protein L7S55_08885 [Luminiphilus sp.]|nr:hypothetical protein [Luminiphilus sp.]
MALSLSNFSVWKTTEALIDQYIDFMFAEPAVDLSVSREEYGAWVVWTCATQPDRKAFEWYYKTNSDAKEHYKAWRPVLRQTIERQIPLFLKRDNICCLVLQIEKGIAAIEILHEHKHEIYDHLKRHGMAFTDTTASTALPKRSSAKVIPGVRLGEAND